MRSRQGGDEISSSGGGDRAGFVVLFAVCIIIESLNPPLQLLLTRIAATAILGVFSQPILKLLCLFQRRINRKPIPIAIAVFIDEHTTE